MPNPTAADIMTREATLSPEMDIYRAMTKLLRSKLSGAPVVDDQGCLIGMLSERDCFKVLVGGALHGRPGGTVRDFMTQTAESIAPGTSLFEIVHIFLTRPFRKLPVVDDARRVVGQVSRRDALIALERLRDNPWLYGSDDRRPLDETGTGVDSAMRMARERARRSE